MEPTYHAFNGQPGHGQQQNQQPFNAGGGYGAVRSGGSIYTRDPTENETVQGRLRGLLNSDSEYIRSAEAAGRQLAGQRGLMNSSLAAQSSRQAAIQAGLPIAAADAAMYAQAAGQNVDWLNQSTLRAIEAEAAANGAASNNYSPDAIYTNMHERELDRQASERLLQMRIDADERSQGRGFDFQRELTDAERNFLRENRDLGYDFQRENRDLDYGFRREDRDFAAGERQLDRDYDRAIFDDQRADARDARRQQIIASSTQRVLDTILSSPDYFSSPEAAAGFINYFNSVMADLTDGYF